MADTQFDAAMAKAWEKEVRQELQEVDNILIRVAEECQQIPGEDDTILNAVYETGVQMEEAAKELKRQFEEAMDALSKIIAAFEKIVQDGLNKIGKFNGGYRLG